MVVREVSANANAINWNSREKDASDGAAVSLFRHVSDFTMRSYLRIPSSHYASDAARAMLDSKSKEAIVCTISENPIGIVTEHDLLDRVLASGRDPRSTRIIEVMSMPIETVDENSGIGKALLKMADLQIKRLAVTRQGRIVGLITRASLATSSAAASH